MHAIHRSRFQSRVLEWTLLRGLIQSWPATPRRLASDWMNRHGFPDDASDGMLRWEDQGQWARVEILREGPRHDDPYPHADVLQHVLEYEVPLDRLADVAAFSSCIVVDRARGEVSFRCLDQQTIHLLANVFDQLVQRRIDVPKAHELLEHLESRRQQGYHVLQSERLTFRQLGPSEPATGPTLETGSPEVSASGQ